MLFFSARNLTGTGMRALEIGFLHEVRDTYRYWFFFQADVCHAYQILKKHGLPDERIVVMMYDDIAHNEE